MNFDFSQKPFAARALQLATVHHDGITRKYTSEPYINHPKRVCENLLRHGVTDQKVLAAALLHDCMEDEDRFGFKMDQHLINEELGPVVAYWVGCLTNVEVGNRATRKATGVKRIVGAPCQVQAIKLADVIDNITGLAGHDPDFASIYCEEKMALVKALPPHRLTKELAETAYSVVSKEMNTAAFRIVERGREAERVRVQEEADIEAILNSESRRLQLAQYSEMGLF